MSLLLRIVLLVPIAYLVMLTYSAPHATDASGLARLAARKTVKVVAWMAAIVVVMELLEWVFLP